MALDKDTRKVMKLKQIETPRVYSKNYPQRVSGVEGSTSGAGKDNQKLTQTELCVQEY